MVFSWDADDAYKFSSVQLLSCVQFFATPWTTACQVSMSITNSWSLLKLMSIASVMPSNHLILCCSLLLLPPIFPSIRVFSNELVLRIRCPKYWSQLQHQSFQWVFRTDAYKENALDFKIRLVQCVTQLKRAQKVGDQLV